LDIFLCASQQPNDIPYQFKTTGIRVYSFEEALYHTFHYWKQSADDFCSDEFISWVHDALGLSHFAARIRALVKVEAFNTRLINFLQLIDYFDAGDLGSLSSELESWEKRRTWEKLKERGDYLMERGDPDKAAALYMKALLYDENAVLYNNLGIAHMRAGEHRAAYENILAARALMPGNVKLALHAAEAAVYAGLYGEARELLGEAEASDGDNPDIPFLYGLLSFTRNDYARSIEYYQQAIRLSEGREPYYLYALADVYAKIRQYDRALGAIGRAPEKDVLYYSKEAELLALSGNLPAAEKSIQKAIFQRNNDPELWTRLAAYHRMDYDLNTANAAITKALALDPDNERAQLENGRIKKGMGRTKDYQKVLNGILKGFRKKYREMQA
jgi:tetratricopeptide (TPR) repeat protein